HHSCRPCWASPSSTPGFCRPCRQPDPTAAKANSDLQIDRHRLSLHSVPTRRSSDLGAAASMIEALMLGLRERGIAALKEPEVRGRLAQLTDVQADLDAERLQRLKREVAQAWRDDQINKLFESRKSCTKETS